MQWLPALWPSSCFMWEFGSAAQLSCIQLHADKTNGRGTHRRFTQPGTTRKVLRARSRRGQGYKMTADAVFQIQCSDLESQRLTTAPPWVDAVSCMLRANELRKAAEASAEAGQAVLGETGQPLQKTFANICSGQPVSDTMSCAGTVAAEQGLAFGRTRKVRSPFLQMRNRLEDHACAEAMASSPFNLEQTLKHTVSSW